MRYEGLFKDDQQFFDDMDEHFNRYYLHVRRIEWAPKGMIRIVFFVRRDESGYVHVKGYDFYLKEGKKKIF
ncbi:MAG: hypothetical protein PHT56_02810 [Candidatus Izemoplasmatales bacterium]|nr:hypothetical protein [Candidatus Izemoplasmatales bacterium]